MRGRAGHDVKRRPMGRLRIPRSKGARGALFYLLRGFGELALVSCGCIAMNEALACGTVEELHRRQSLFSVARGRSLERGAERGFLGAVADGSGARLPHVFFG